MRHIVTLSRLDERALQLAALSTAVIALAATFAGLALVLTHKLLMMELGA